MKPISVTLFFLACCSLLQAKMISQVSVSKVHSVSIADGNIVIVGDGVFQSRMVTTDEVKDSDFVIQGQPSAAYTAQGYRVKFIIKPHDLLTKAHRLDTASIQAYNQNKQADWDRSLELAKKLKSGQAVQFAIKGEEVVFRKGVLVSVSGSGGGLRLNQ